jgi:hypothetical protein
MKTPPNPLLLRDSVVGYDPCEKMATKSIPPQPSLTRKGGSKDVNSPLILRGNTRGINS